MKKTEKSKYSSYSKETQAFMKNVESHVKKTFGAIECQWEGLLQILASNYELFWHCEKTIAKEGLTYITDRGKIEKHPLLKVQTEAQIQLIKLVGEFGISPKSIKLVNVSGNEDEAEFLNNLVG